MRRLAPSIVAAALAACAPIPPGGYPAAYGQQQPLAQAAAQPLQAGPVRWEGLPSPVARLAAEVSARDLASSPESYQDISGALYDAGGGRRVLLAQDGPWSGTSMHGFAVFLDRGDGRFQQAGAASARSISPSVAVVPVRGSLPSLRVTGEMFDPRRPNAPSRQRTMTLRYDPGTGKYVEASR